MIHELLATNWNVFELLNQPAGHEPGLDPLMIFGAQDVIFLLPLFLLILWAGLVWWIPRAQRGTTGATSGATSMASAGGTSGKSGLGGDLRALGQRFALLAIPAVVIAIVLNLVIGAVLYEPRPFVSHPGVVHQLVAHAADGSFPSDHEAVASAMATMLVIFLVAVLLRWRRASTTVSSAGTSRLLTLAAVCAALGVLATIFVGVARVYVGVHYPGDILGGAGCGILGGLVAARIRPYAEPVLAGVVELAARFRLA